MRFARSIVSIRDVAVTMCEEPAVSDVKRNNRGSLSQSLRSVIVVMVVELRGVWGLRFYVSFLWLLVSADAE